MPDGVEVDTSGLDRMLRILRARVGPIGADAARDAAERVADETRGTLPRRSGRLAGSVRVDKAPTGAAVAMGTPYAGWIEFGGSRGRAYVAEGRYLGAATRGADRLMVLRAEAAIQREARLW